MSIAFMTLSCTAMTTSDGSCYYIYTDCGTAPHLTRKSLQVAEYPTAMYTCSYERRPPPRTLRRLLPLPGNLRPSSDLWNVRIATQSPATLRAPSLYPRSQLNPTYSLS